jgi:uncharacterized protein YecE (DUF72 family)
MRGRAFVGISGWDYASWRGKFYPKPLPKKRWLEHALRSFNSIELNGTFYSLKKPSSYEAWTKAAREFASREFIYAVKGGRFITHMKKLKDCEQPLANFFASGVLALEETTGPFLWQLPEVVQLDVERLAEFFSLLPRSSKEAAKLAAKHDARLDGRSLVTTKKDIPCRHVLEPRHPTFFTEEASEILSAYGIGLVVADTAGRFPMATDVTAPFVYYRLHGSTQLYASGYTDEELALWSARMQFHRDRGRDVYAYFDNDALGHAPFDALRLTTILDDSRPSVAY